MAQIFSPNMLKTYERCPKRYYFRYVKGLSMPVDEDAFLLGKNIHALAAYYLKGENIDNMLKSLNSQEAEIWNYLINLKYFKYEVINAEYTLSVKIGNTFFGGRLDALVKNDGHYYILDYKTGSAPKNAASDFQTMIYLLGVNKFFKTSDVSFVYIDLKNKSDVRVDFSEDLISEYESKLSEISSKIEKECFNPSKKDCIHCEYGKICYDKLLD